MKFFYPDFESEPEIGDLLTWEQMPMGGYGAYRIWNGRYYSPFPTVLSKEDWVINPNENGVTYIQGITRNIDPGQFVIFLGYVDQVESRMEFLNRAARDVFPMEGKNE